MKTHYLLSGDAAMAVFITSLTMSSRRTQLVQLDAEKVPQALAARSSVLFPVEVGNATGHHMSAVSSQFIVSMLCSLLQ